MIDIGILNELNAPAREERLDNLRRIAEKSVFPPMEPRYTPPARRGSAPQA